MDRNFFTWLFLGAPGTEMAFVPYCCLRNHSELEFSPWSIAKKTERGSPWTDKSTRRQSSLGWKSQSLKGCNWPSWQKRWMF